MPRQLALAALITTMGLGMWWGLQASHQQDAAPKSKSQILQFEKSKSAYLHSEKLTGPLRVTITADRPGPIAINDTVTLTGEISTAEPLSDVKVVWSVDPTIEVISGADQAILASLSPSSPQTIQIVIRPKASGRSRVHLLASAQQGGIAFSQVAQWATQKEKKDFITEKDLEPESQQKIHH